MSMKEMVDLMLFPPVLKDVALLVIIMSLVQISPLKLNPWTWLKSIAEIPKRLDDLYDRLKKLEREFNDDKAFRWRNMIFSRARLIQAAMSGKGEFLSREEWGETLDTTTNYERYCKANPDFENDKITQTIAFVRSSYQYCLEHNLFL